MGNLYIVGTPIGNLEDITFRAVRVLREVSLIAAEDTRKARILLEHYDIKTPVTSFFAGNERRKAAVILTALAQGDVALISEAGMPTISDPGYPLVATVTEAGGTVIPIPGPSAHTTALVASGLPTDRFLFLGFLPRKSPALTTALEELVAIPATLICYESPRRVRNLLQQLLAVLGNRPVALCRELTKRYEDIWRGELAGVLSHLDEQAPRGEFTIVVGGASRDSAERWDTEQVLTALNAARDSGLSHSQAAREVAQRSGWQRGEVYDLAISG